MTTETTQPSAASDLPQQALRDTPCRSKSCRNRVWLPHGEVESGEDRLSGRGPERCTGCPEEPGPRRSGWLVSDRRGIGGTDSGGGSEPT